MFWGKKNKKQPNNPLPQTPKRAATVGFFYCDVLSVRVEIFLM